MDATHLTAENLGVLDSPAIDVYNRRAPPKFRLQISLGPSAFEGNLDRAAVVMLLANPGFDSSSTLDDHRFQREGWPLASLHPDAPAGCRKWMSMRLQHLIREFGERTVANVVACLQLTPWASEKFDNSLRLPSRALLLDTAAACARRGAVLIVMRAERLWLESRGVAQAEHRFRVNSWRSSYLSPGNLSADGWQAVVQAIRAA